MTDYERIERAIEFIEKNFREQPSLKEVAGAVRLSEFHLQRLFRRWAGISPKRFLQFLTAEYARGVLESSQNVFEATYDAGLSGPGRLHDLFVNVYAATPAQVRHAGAGLRVGFGFAGTPFGEALVGMTERGLCALSFVGSEGRRGAVGELRARWPRATLEEEGGRVAKVVRSLFSAARPAASGPLTVHLQGTNFQIRVWEALLRIPPGSVTSYQAVAAAVEKPTAVRSVGAAVGQNPVAFVIPCHRVLNKSGALSGYRWGVQRKRAMLGWEAARREG